jgi:hypothetical protein
VNENPVQGPNRIIDFSIYADVVHNEQLLNSLIQQWIGIYNKYNRTTYRYVSHTIGSARLQQHRKVNIEVMKSAAET